MKIQTVSVLITQHKGEVFYLPWTAVDVPWHSARDKDEAMALSVRALDPFQGQ